MPLIKPSLSSLRPLDLGAQVHRNERSSAFGIGAQVVSEQPLKWFRNTQPAVVGFRNPRESGVGIWRIRYPTRSRGCLGKIQSFSDCDTLALRALAFASRRSWDSLRR
jgi:hypothetical protein